MVCAALQAPQLSARKPSANQRANHFPKDVRYYRNEAQTILIVPFAGSIATEEPVAGKPEQQGGSSRAAAVACSVQP